MVQRKMYLGEELQWDGEMSSIYPITITMTPGSQIQQLEVKAARLQPALQMRVSLSSWVTPSHLNLSPVLGLEQDKSLLSRILLSWNP